jgi:hypothetical protein
VAYRAEPICNGIYNAQFGGLISGCCMTGSLKFFSEPTGRVAGTVNGIFVLVRSNENPAQATRAGFSGALSVGAGRGQRGRAYAATNSVRRRFLRIYSRRQLLGPHKTNPCEKAMDDCGTMATCALKCFSFAGTSPIIMPPIRLPPCAVLGARPGCVASLTLRPGW